MTKRREIEDPNSCLNKGGDDRLKFVIDAMDVAAPYAIREWVKRRLALGKNDIGDAQTTQALAWAETVEKSLVQGGRLPAAAGKVIDDGGVL